LALTAKGQIVFTSRRNEQKASRVTKTQPRQALL
jgi:hypothetical protein